MNKPQEYTSFDVVARVRGMAKTKRVGHSGTLDPMATGVLPVFIGNATKACSLLPNDDKSYTASFRLGVQTDTQDIWGKVTCETADGVSRDGLLSALSLFRGETEQIPPMYSAVKVNGQRLYDIARRGGEVERAARKISVYRLELLSYQEESRSGELLVECSKGTYIRTLISDIGDRLGVGGVMSGLIRTNAAGFSLSDCFTLEEVQALALSGELEGRLLPVEAIFTAYPALHLNEIQTRKFKNGVRLDLNRLQWKQGDCTHRVFGYDGGFLGLAHTAVDSMELILEKMF